ncbi:MAG TPA: histidine phosphatase family protein [Stellaceae bacterium]|nr:histidine phosphatase family protein [Stellaceae bacterium]
MILIRHGQSEFNVVFGATRRDPGIRDPKLTEEGRKQAETLAERLAEHDVARLIASPYRRALETAEILATRLDLAIEVQAVVGERAAFTCDIGSSPAELSERWPHLDLAHLPEQWWPDFEESEPQLHRRCARFREHMTTQADWRRVAVVTHWGFIRGLTGLTLPNAAAIRIDPHRPEVEPEPLHIPAEKR